MIGASPLPPGALFELPTFSLTVPSPAFPLSAAGEAILLLCKVTIGWSVEVGGFLESARETAKLPQSREVELTVRQRPEAALPPSDTREAAPVPTELRADQPVLSTLPGKMER